jgi:general secretion pathway protein L
MRTLSLKPSLSTAPTADAYDWAWLQVGVGAPAKGISSAPLPLLPAIERRDELVLLVPAQALSWHRLKLPLGLKRSGAQLLPALQGMLEERLLQDVSKVHFALQPNWASAQQVWVATCDKDWLQSHLAALDAVGLAVQRVVPEFCPAQEGEPARWLAAGPAESGMLWCVDAQNGVMGWPVDVAAEAAGLIREQALAAWLPGTRLQAEPAQAAWAASLTPLTGHPPELVDTGAHWLAALDGDWDLAQFGLQTSSRARSFKRWAKGWQALRLQPSWRPVRWGVAALLLAQVLGLNVWAWKTQAHWQSQQEGWTLALQKSFPSVTLVVDAPVQMEREVARLRRETGQLGVADLEPMLLALHQGMAQAQIQSPTAVRYQDGQVELQGWTFSREAGDQLTKALAQRGYRLSLDSNTARLQVAKP